MDRPPSVEWLVVAGGVDGESAEQFAVLGHDADLSTSHEDVDRLVAVSRSDADVSEAAAVAQRHGAGLVDAVATDAVLDGSELSRGSGLDPGGEGFGRRAALERAMRTGLVVVAPEGIELRLEVEQRAGGRLTRQEALEGLVETLDLAAGLRVVGGGVLGD